MSSPSQRVLDSSKRVIVVGNYGQEHGIIVLKKDNVKDQSYFYSKVKPAYFEAPTTVELNDQKRKSREFISPLHGCPADKADKYVKCELSYSDQSKNLNNEKGHVKNKAAAERGLKKLRNLKEALKTVWQLDTLSNRVRILEKAYSHIQNKSNNESTSFEQIIQSNDGKIIDAIADFLFCSSNNSWEKESLERLDSELKKVDEKRAFTIKETLTLWKKEKLTSPKSDDLENTYITLERAWKQIEEVVNGAVDQAEIFAGIVSHLDPNQVIGVKLSASLMRQRDNTTFAKLKRPIPDEHDRIQAEKNLSIDVMNIPEDSAEPVVCNNTKGTLLKELLKEDNRETRGMTQPELKYDKEFIIEVAKEYVGKIVAMLNPVVQEAQNEKNKFGHFVYEEFLKPLWESKKDKKDEVRGAQFRKLLIAYEDLREIYQKLGKYKDNSSIDLLKEISDWIDVEKLSDRMKSCTEEDCMLNAIALTKIKILAEKIKPVLGEVSKNIEIAQSIVLTIPKDDAHIPLLTHGGIMSGRYFIFQQLCNLGEIAKIKLDQASGENVKQITNAYQKSFGSLTSPAQIGSNLGGNVPKLPPSTGSENDQGSGEAQPVDNTGKQESPHSDVPKLSPSTGSENDQGSGEAQPVDNTNHEQSSAVEESAFQDPLGLMSCVDLGEKLVEKYGEISKVNSNDNNSADLEAYFNVVVLAQFLLGSHKVLGQEDLSAMLPILLSAVGEWGSGPGCSKCDFFNLSEKDANTNKWIAKELNWPAWPLSVFQAQQQIDLGKIFDYLLASATSRDTVDEFAEEVRQLAEFCQVVTKHGGEVVLVKDPTQTPMIDHDDPRSSLLAQYPARCVVLAPDEKLNLQSLCLTDSCNNIFIPIVVTRFSTQRDTLNPGVLPVIYTDTDEIKNNFQFYQGDWEKDSPNGFYLGNNCRFINPNWLLTAALLNLPHTSCGTVNQTPASYQKSVRDSYAWTGTGTLLSGLRKYLEEQQVLAIVSALALINSLRDDSVLSRFVNKKITGFPQITNDIFQKNVKPVYENLVSLDSNSSTLPKLMHPDVNIELFSGGTTWKSLKNSKFGNGYSFENFNIKLKTWGFSGREIDNALYDIINKLVF